MKSKTALLCIIALCCSVLLTGCPNQMDMESVKSGEYFRKTLTTEFLVRYDVIFDTKLTPDVILSYQSYDGSVKRAGFKLDGYDANKKIGYKIILKKDFDEWKALKSSNPEVPDLNDFKLIQKAAADHEYPIVFIDAYQYQDRIDMVTDNDEKLKKEIAGLIKSTPIIKWGEEGLYSGEWIKRAIERYALISFQISFTHENLPTVEIPYGNEKTAVFQLDGFDAQKGYGYKFVTQDDASKWNTLRSEGDLTAPDLSESDSIKQAAFLRHSVLFIYVPEYWKVKVFDIVEKEVLKTLH